MKDYQQFFKGKKITMLGLGLLGRGLNDAKFLAQCGAKLIITDLKTKKELAVSIKKLKSYKLPTNSYKLHLGGHRLEDFRNRDLILKAAGVPLDSPYIMEAKKNNISVEMDDPLFSKLANDVKVVGITGTRGKTTVTYLIYEILKKAFGNKVYLGGNIKGIATLPLLKKVKAGDIIVMELSSWQLQGWGDASMSPHISVFTNFMDDHLNYYKKISKSEEEAKQKYFYDKSLIYKNQKENNFLICGENMGGKIISTYGKKIISTKRDVPKSWKLKIKGEHNFENIACAIKVAEVLNVPAKIIKEAVENFSGVEGRQEFLREYKGIKIYNDTTSTTPDATIAALKSLGDLKKKIIVLIMGGADKTLNMAELVRMIPRYSKKVILLEGSGTKSISGKIDGIMVKNLKNGLLEALKWSKKGDILLLSPGFASFGMFKNEFDRGEKFVKLVKNLKL